MKLLMFLRDPLPPIRVDVAVLFDRCLRAQGIATDYVGDRAASPPEAVCRGREFDVGSPLDPRSVWRQLRLLWRHGGEYQHIVVRDRPLLATLIFALARSRGWSCVYWMSFPIPLGDREGAADHWRAGRWLRAVVTWLRGSASQWLQDRLVLPWSSHVFVQSEAMRVQVLSADRLVASKVSAVPMGIDADLLVGDDLADGVASDPGASPVIAYLGSLDRSRRLDVLVDALALVRVRWPNARLMLIGSAPREDDVAWLRGHAQQRGVGQALDFTGALPMRRAWAQLREASVCVSSVPPGPMHDVSSPTKIVEYLALGLPAVGNDIPDQRALMDACGAGVCVAYSAQDFARGIAQVLSSPHAAREQARQARPRVLALRSYDVLTQQVAGVLNGLEA